MTAPVRAAQRFVGTVAIEIHCRRCGRAFVPSAEAIRSGPEVYRVCPDCRSVDVTDEKREVPA